MGMGWWILIAFVLGVIAASWNIYCKRKRTKALEEIGDAVISGIRSTIKNKDKLNNKN